MNNPTPYPIVECSPKAKQVVTIRALQNGPSKVQTEAEMLAMLHPLTVFPFVLLLPGQSFIAPNEQLLNIRQAAVRHNKKYTDRIFAVYSHGETVECCRVW